jgi:hypothetical protein
MLVQKQKFIESWDLKTEHVIVSSLNDAVHMEKRRPRHKQARVVSLHWRQVPVLVVQVLMLENHANEGSFASVDLIY